MRAKREPERLFSLKEAAALLGVHTNTVRRWHDAGELGPILIIGPKLRRITASGLAAFQRRRTVVAGGTTSDANAT